MSSMKTGKLPRVNGVQAARRRYNISAHCGDGCLDKLVVAVRRGKPTPLPIVAGAMLPEAGGSRNAADGSRSVPLLLLGLLSGSQARRDMLRCSWMRVSALAEHGVRVLFIVGKANAEKSPDVLPVDVVEGAFMRSKADAVRNVSRTFDPKKLIRTGSVTTYWKLVEWLKYSAAAASSGVSFLTFVPQSLLHSPFTPHATLCLLHRYAATQLEPMIGRADDDVFISPRMLIAHASLLLQHSRSPAAGSNGLVFAGVFEWYSWRTRTLMSTGFGLSAGASRTRRKKQWRNCSATGSGTSREDPCTGPVAFAKGPLMLMTIAAARGVVDSALFKRDVEQVCKAKPRLRPTACLRNALHAIHFLPRLVRSGASAVCGRSQGLQRPRQRPHR